MDAVQLAQARIRTEYQVMFFDTDCAAVVHNIAYLRLIETARTHLAAELGWSLAEMARSQQFPVVVRTEIDYKRPAVLGDLLVIDGWLERVERIRFWCAFTITRPSDGALLIRCRQMLALVQMPAGKPIRLPEEIQTRFAHLGQGRPTAEESSSRMYGGQVVASADEERPPATALPPLPAPDAPGAPSDARASGAVYASSVAAGRRPGRDASCRGPP